MPCLFTCPSTTSGARSTDAAAASDALFLGFRVNGERDVQFFCYSAPARSVEFGARCAQHTEPVYHYHNGTPAQLQTLCGLKVRRVFICEGVYSKGCPAQRQAASSGVSPCLAADASAPLSNIPAGPTVPREEGRGGVEVRATRQGSNETRRQEAGGRFCCPAGPTPLAQTQHTDEPLFTDKHAKRALRGHELQHGRTGPPRSLARTGFERGAHALATDLREKLADVDWPHG